MSLLATVHNSMRQSPFAWGKKKTKKKILLHGFGINQLGLKQNESFFYRGFHLKGLIHSDHVIECQDNNHANNHLLL